MIKPPKNMHCAYCGEASLEVAVNAQRAISKKSTELYPYQICQKCYSILDKANYLKNADKLKNKQTFWDKVDKNLRKKKREEVK